jgi:hypothetical protein
MLNKKHPKKVEIQKPDRRKFIRDVAAASLTIFINNNNSNKWDFLSDDKYRDYKPSKETILNDYVYIYSHEVTDGDLLQSPDLEKIAMETIAQKGYNLPNYTIGGTSFDYAAPETLFSEDLKEYCESTQEFLNSRIRGIASKVEWVIPKKGNVLGNVNGKGVLCDSIMVAVETKIIDPSTQSELFGFVYGEQKKGGTAFFNFEGDKPLMEYLVISTGRASVTAPFSEMIGMATAAKMNEHSKNGLVEALKTNEALHEGIAYVLVRDFARIKRIPGSYEMIEATLKENMTRPLYDYLRPSIEWIIKNGIQQAYDLYMESPQKFLDAIKNF